MTERRKELLEYIFDLFRQKVRFPEGVTPKEKTLLDYPTARFILNYTIFSENFLNNPTMENLNSIFDELCKDDRKANEWIKKTTIQKKAMLFFVYERMKEG